MKEKLEHLRELQAKTERRRNVWKESVKNKIIDDMTAISNQFNLGIIPQFKEITNFETLIFALPKKHLGLMYEGQVAYRTGAAICFAQLTNGKIEVFIETAKIELLQIETPEKFIQLGVFEPEEVYQKRKEDFFDSLFTHLIDFDSHEETMKIASV